MTAAKHIKGPVLFKEWNRTFIMCRPAWRNRQTRGT